MVLVVDAYRDRRETLSIILEDEGYRVVTAAHGEQAFEHLRTGPKPDLILLDLMMPVMDGWTFRRRLREDHDLAGIPVLLISGRNDVDRHVGPLAAEGYFRKPFNVPEMLETVRGIVGGDPVSGEW
jgi:CheY-like chemotaxis protein